MITLKVFETEIKLDGPPYKFDPKVCELSLLCVDDKRRIFTIHEVENKIDKSDITTRYSPLHKLYGKLRNEIIEKTIKKYPFDNVKKWFGIFYSDPKLFPIDTPIKEIYLYFDFSDFLAMHKRVLTDQEISEIYNNSKVDELYELIKLGYTKFMEKLEHKALIKIAKMMISDDKINLELFRKIKIKKGQNQIIWIVKNKLYPLLNLHTFSKKTWIEALDYIIKDLPKILAYIDSKTFDIIEPMIEWDEYKVIKPNDLRYKINKFGYGFKMIPKYFNNSSDQEVMKEVYKKFYSSNPDNYDIGEAEFDFCYAICKIKPRDLEEVKKNIEFLRKVEYSLTN